jgi:outer membrane murein-binding lipoprotein Lpp
MGLDSIRQWALFVCIIAVVSMLAGCAMTARVDDTSFSFTFKRFVDEKDL